MGVPRKPLVRSVYDSEGEAERSGRERSKKEIERSGVDRVLRAAHLK